MPPSQRVSWLAQILEIGLQEEVCSDKDILGHIGPDALAEYIPEQLIAEMLTSALQSGGLSASTVVHTVSPRVFAESVPHAMLWEVVVSGVNRNKGCEALKRFLEGVIATGLECEVLTAEGILEHVTPETLAKHLPVKLKAKLLGACLSSKEVSPSFVLDIVGSDALLAHCPEDLLWAAVEGAMSSAASGSQTKTGPKSKSSKKKASKGPRTHTPSDPRRRAQENIDLNATHAGTPPPPQTRAAGTVDGGETTASGQGPEAEEIEVVTAEQPAAKTQDWDGEETKPGARG